MNQQAALVPGRDCGECTLCCQVQNIDKPDVQKPSGLLCRNCVGGGCAIYETRYEVCRTFHCAWRQLANLDESWRPDRSGILIRFIEREDLPEEFRAAGSGVHFTVLGGEAAITRAGFAPYVTMLVRRGVGVWLSADSPRTLINPYLKPAALAKDDHALTAMLLHIYRLHLQQRQGKERKPLPWITPD